MKKFVLFSFLVFSFALPPSGLASYFSDVSTSHENFAALEYLEFMGVVEGYWEEGDREAEYRPDLTINRAEFTKIVVEAYFDEDEIEDCDTRYFDDLVSGEWYVPYICVAKEQGLVSGYSDGMFKPSDEINFVETAKIISNTYEFDYEEDEPWYRSYVENLEMVASIPTSIDDFDEKISRGEMAEMIYRLMRGVTYKETTRFYTDDPEIPSEPKESSCGLNSYTMAFLVLTKPGEDLSDEDGWEDLTDEFEEGFFRATDYRVEMQADNEIFSLELNEDMLNDYYLEGYESGEYSLDDLVSSSHLDLYKVSSAFYDSHDDDYDFLSIYFDFEPQEYSKQSHANVRQPIEGIGLNVNLDGTSFGSDSRLLGINWMEDRDSTESEVQTLLHETGHQWCCAVGGVFEPGTSDDLPLGGTGSHQYMGLDGPDNTGIMGSVSAYYVFNESEEEYLGVSTSYTGLPFYHPFTLYYMGVLLEEEFDREWDLYDVEDEDEAIYYGSYSVNDIIDYEGERSCEE